MSESDDTNDRKSGRERLRFFEGQLLTSDDFVAEREYLRERMRTQNRMIRGWGVVCGLSVPAS